MERCVSPCWLLRADLRVSSASFLFFFLFSFFFILELAWNGNSINGIWSVRMKCLVLAARERDKDNVHRSQRDDEEVGWRRGGGGGRESQRGWIGRGKNN